jgi:ankyrin repeat protein
VDSENIAPIHVAAMSDIPSIMDYLLDQAVNVKQQALQCGSSLFHMLPGSESIYRNQSLLERVVKAGLDVNIKDSMGYTPLHRASVALDSALISALLGASYLEISQLTQRQNLAQTQQPPRSLVKPH